MGGTYPDWQGCLRIESHTTSPDPNAKLDPHLEFDFHHYDNPYTQPDTNTNSDLHTDT
jgi:hypothetical protein